MVALSQFDVVLVQLDPTVGREIKKTRPCVIVSPNVINKHLDTLIVLPMTTKIKSFPSRIKATFQNQACEIAADQIRTISIQRIVKRIGKLNIQDAARTSEKLVEIFTLK